MAASKKSASKPQSKKAPPKYASTRNSLTDKSLANLSAKNKANVNKNSGKRSFAKKPGGRKALKDIDRNSSPVSGEVWAILGTAVGILIMLSIYINSGDGFIGRPIRVFFLGMFGFGAYILPLLVITLSLFTLINKEYSLRLSKVLESSVIFICVITFVHMLSVDVSEQFDSFASYISEYFSNGAISNGGFTGAIFGNFFLRFFGTFGAFLMVIIVFITFGILLTDRSFFNLAASFVLIIKDKLTSDFQETYEDDADEKPIRNPRRHENKEPVYELPPITTVVRRKPSNFTIENIRKPLVEEKILIFNRAERSPSKPILMPPTRKNIVDVITLSTPENSETEGYEENREARILNKDEVFVETPLIKYYERRSFTEPTPFSSGSYTLKITGEDNQSGEPDSDEMHYDRAFTPQRQSGEPDSVEMHYDRAFTPQRQSGEPDSDEMHYDRAFTPQRQSGEPDSDDTFGRIKITGELESQIDGNLQLSDLQDEDLGYESFINEDLEDDIFQNTGIQNPSGYSNIPDDEFEQKLQEQELNALLMASTGPFRTVDARSGADMANAESVQRMKNEKINTEKPSEDKAIIDKTTPDRKLQLPPYNHSGKKLEINISEIKHDEYTFPPLNLMNDVPVNLSSLSRTQILETSRKLEETLKSFGVDAKVIEVSKGPTVTRYELSPGSGVKVSKISGLADDLALNLAAEGIRIEAPIPGKAAVGIEVPNKEVTPVYLREVIDNEIFQNFPSKLAFALGKDIAGDTVVTDIAKMPHLLIAGATGSGKSVCINTLITSLIYKSNPDDVKLLMVDPKVVELSIYNGIPHLLIPVVTDPKKAAGALNWAVQEMLSRYNSFAETNVRDLKGYNSIVKERGEGEPMPQIVIIIDELADLMMAAPGEVEDAICRLAQMARAAGLHLIIATQRPSVDVITGVIKANIPSRLAFSVSSGTDSRTILDMVGAEKLLGKGDMLFCPMGTSKPIRVQGAFISDKEVESIVNFLKQSFEQNYDADIIAKITAAKVISDGGSDIDEFFDEAIEFIIQKEKASASMLQRQFRIGYNRASRLIEEFEARGIIGAEDGSKPRKVLMTSMEWEEYKMNRQ